MSFFDFLDFETPVRPKVVRELPSSGVWRIEPVGSRRSVSPPPMDTDDDWLVYCSKKVIKRMIKELKGKNGSSSPGSEFTSLRSGDVNLILTSSGEFFERFMAAQGLCKRLNLKDKDDRIRVFRAVLYKESP